MESVATEILNLSRLLGLPIIEQRQPQGSATVLTLRVPELVRDVRARVTGAGTITINVPKGQCLAVVEISTSYVDETFTNTVQIGTQSHPGINQNLAFVRNKQILYGFGPSVPASFVFVFFPEPGAAAALAEVRGYFLPASALPRLKTLGSLIV
jgi:hypothetical protein